MNEQKYKTFSLSEKFNGKKHEIKIYYLSMNRSAE